MSTIYIAGPISGVPDFAERFAAAEYEIEALGHTVINPAILPLGLTPADYMRISLAELEGAEAVALLPGWAASGGAQIEALSALYAGKKLFEYKYNIDAEQGELSPLDAEKAKEIIGVALFWSDGPAINDEDAKNPIQRPFTMPTKAEWGKERPEMGHWWRTLCTATEDGGPGDCTGLVPMDIEGFRELDRQLDRATTGDGYGKLR